MSQLPSPTDPALAPPEGIPVESYDPNTLFPYQALAVVFSVILTTIMVFARIYTKKVIIKAVKWEDHTCLFGWATFMIYLALEYCIGIHGGGTHQWNLQYHEFQYMKRYTNYTDLIYSLSIFATKTSILLLILRIFCTTHRDLGYWLTMSLIVVNGIFYACFFFVPIFLCSPRAKIWTPAMPGSCRDDNALYLASAAFNMVSDIAMLSVPIYLIWNLQMSVQRKMGISAIFGTGALACISSIVRLAFHVRQVHNPDYTFVQFQAALWTIPEVACGLICSCLVILPRLYQHLASIQPIHNESATMVQAGNGAARSPKSSRREWIRMTDRKDHTLTSLPSKIYQGAGSHSDDDQGLDSAIQGTSQDVERGIFRK